MQSFFSRYAFLSLLLVVSLFSAFSLNEVYAQEKVVTAKSIGFEETTIIEFENNGETEIQTFRIWLGNDVSFKSFKTEKGWTGEKTPQGVIIFTASEPIKFGQSVKFGVKTDKSQPAINWKAIDKNQNELEIGKTLVTESPSKPITEGVGILSDSTFRLIPEKPNVGATVRVTGEKFVSNHKFDFYVGSKFLESFETNDDGYFIFTTKLPETQIAERVDFIVKDKQGNEKTISLRLGDTEPRMTQEQVRLTIDGLPSTINPGDVLLISGTGNPGGTITGKIKNPEGSVVTTEAVPVSPQGKWSFQTIVSLDIPLGKYEAEISDGLDTIQRTWMVESSKVIHITPTKIKFDPGETLTFNGTAIPNQKIEVILENPKGVEIFSDIIQPKSDGFFEIKFPTEQSSVQGTYALIAFQGEDSEIVLVGLGELPEVQLVTKMDKLNYKSGETAIISLIGPSSSTLSLLIIDPSDKPKWDDTIILGPDGKKDYELDLTGFASGVYTTVITRGNAQAEEKFSVGLQFGSGEISVSTTKLDYKPGDSVLVLGNSGANILLTITLYDPDGNEVKKKEAFTNKAGHYSEGSFRIPSDAKIGVWKVKAVSGPNFAESDFQVLTSEEQGMVVFVESIETISSVGKIVNIRIVGASQTTIISILSNEGVEVGHLEFVPTGAGNLDTPWPVPKDTPPGVYTIKVKDAFNTAETTFVLE
jgi:hypothetical protein